MTGEKISPNYDAALWREDDFLQRLDSLSADYRLLGPVTNKDRSVFKEVDSAAEIDLEAGRTMNSPGKTFFYKASQDLVQFEMKGEVSLDTPPAISKPSLLIGIRPCDVHALLYLDNTFSADPYYRAVRENTLLVTVNCRQPTPYCFCSSMGTGPFFEKSQGSEAVLTKLEEGWLVEPLSKTAEKIFLKNGRPLEEKHWREKKEQQITTLDKITKKIDLAGIESLLINNQNHLVWSRTADERCLSCTNCVMVCPTCFCHDVRDRVEMDLNRAVRYRQWDACQDINFASVHGGNFRQTRTARLRQFVCHKLDYTSQYGQFGTVGCGRCIEWCPTSIDLTEMAKEIRRDAGEK